MTFSALLSAASKLVQKLLEGEATALLFNRQLCGRPTAILKAFGGLDEDKLEPVHLLCRWHFGQTWKRNIKHQAVINHLWATQINRFTEAGAVESSQAAINTAKEIQSKQKRGGEKIDQVEDLDVDCADFEVKKGDTERVYEHQQAMAESQIKPEIIEMAKEKKKKKDKKQDLVAYITNEYAKDTRKWCNYAREHSALLKQAPTTNPIKKYLRVFKEKTTGRKAALVKMFLKGTLRQVTEVNHQFDTRAEEAAANWAIKKLPIWHKYPPIAQLPHLTQSLTTEQLNLAETKIEDGVEVKWEDPNKAVSCRCAFFKKCQALCHHIFHKALMYGITRNEDWTSWIFIFEDCGIEVYEGMEKIYVANKLLQMIGAPARTKLKFRELTKTLGTIYYRLREELAEKMDDEAVEAYMERWINGLMEATSLIIRQSGSALSTVTSPRNRQSWTVRTRRVYLVRISGVLIGGTSR